MYFWGTKYKGDSVRFFPKIEKKEVRGFMPLGVQREYDDMKLVAVRLVAVSHTKREKYGQGHYNYAICLFVIYEIKSKSWLLEILDDSLAS